MAEWLIVAIKEYLFVKETSSSTVMGSIRCLFDSLWVQQLKKFGSLISWPPWLENLQSWIIQIGAEFIIGFSDVFRKKTARRTKPFCDDKISGFRNWLIEVWCQLILVGLAYQDFPLTQKNKSRYYKKLWFFVLQINWLAASNTLFSSSKTRCSISATSCWVLKSKDTPLMLDRLYFKAQKLDDSTGLVEFFLTPMFRLIACNIGDEVFDSKGTLF